MNVNDIHAREDKRLEVRKVIYKEIYEQATRKVSRAVDVGIHYATFEIPSFVLGMPSFDRGKALTYITRQFQNGGFSARHIQGWEIVISWERERGTTQKTVEPPTPQADTPVADDSDFSSFINLRKTAERLKQRK
jgi:hypothetical protein